MIAALSLSIFVPCFAGCAVDASGDPAGDETVAEVQYAYGEPGCETVTADPKTQPGIGVTVYSSSPDASYGPATCPQQWVAEFTTQKGPQGTHIQWNDTLPSNQFDCEHAYLLIGAYTANSAGVWSYYGGESSGATWNSGTSTCSFSGGAGLYIPSSSKIRLAGQAQQCTSTSFCFTWTDKKVKVGLTGAL